MTFWRTRQGPVSRRNLVDELSRLFALAYDPDGFKREEAVRQLRELGNADALAVLYERANDWVPQVRQAALDAIRQLMIPGNASAFVNALPAAFHLANCGRSDHRQLLEEVSSFLSAPTNLSVLILGLDSGDRRVRRLCYDIAFTHATGLLEGIAERAVRDPDPVIQLEGVVHAAALQPSPSQSILGSALQSPAARVRVAALRACFKQTESDLLLGMARRCALDRSAAIREVASHWLRDQGHDVAAVFTQSMRQAGAPAATIRAAILGIAEIRRSDLLEEVLRHSKSPYPAVRAAVLTATARLDADHARDMCERALEDPSPGVVRQAARLLVKLGVRFDAQRLVELIRPDGQYARRHVALFLSRHSTKWERLGFLLRVAERSDVVPDLRSELRDWLGRFNRSAIDPTAEQWQVLRSLLDTQKTHVPPELREQLRFALGVKAGAMGAGRTQTIWTERDQCRVLDDLVTELGKHYLGDPQNDLALLIFNERTYTGKGHADLSLIARRRSFLFRSASQLYRVIRYERLLDALFEVGDYGFCSLIGVPSKEVPRIQAAFAQGRAHVGYEDRSCLPDLLGRMAPYFELAMYTSSCIFWITFSPACPENLRRIFGEATERLPNASGS